jgi:oligosaccharide repeat unit polymerase
MFTISTCVAMMNVNIWKFAIAPITVVIILTSLMAFGAGELLVNLINYNRKQRVLYIPPQKPIETSLWSILFLCSILGLFLLHYYTETVKIARRSGYTDGLILLWYAKQALQDPTVNRDRVALLGEIAGKASAYIFSFIYLYNRIFLKKSKNIRNFFPVLIYIPYIILSSGRVDFIILITIWIIIGGIFFMQKNQWDPHLNIKILRNAFLGIFSFLLFFVIAGSFRRSDMLERPLFFISNYTGQSIPALNDFILHPRPPGIYFGEHSLFGIYSFLRKLGFDYPSFYEPYDFIYIGNVHANVYSIIRRYLEDFGYIGLYALMFFLGFSCSILFFIVYKCKSLKLIFYAFIIHSIALIAIEERFFMTVITPGTAYLFIALSFFYFMYVDKKYIKEIMNYCFKSVKVKK